MLRNVLRFLRASWDRSLDPVGRFDLILGAVLVVIGWVMNVDLALFAAVGVLSLLLIRVVLITPADMWAEAEAERKRLPQSHPVVGSVEAGGIVNINFYGPREFSVSSNTSTKTAAAQAMAGLASGTGTAFDATVRVAESVPSPEGPRSPGRSRHEPQHPPPSRAS